MPATKPFLFAIALVVAAGCGVKKETHQRVLDTLTAREAELERTRTERDKLEQAINDMEREVERLRAAENAARTQIELLLGSKADVEKELTRLQKQREAAEQRLVAFRQLRDRLRKLVDTGKLSVVFRGGQMVLNLPSEILFASGQSDLSRDGQAALAEVVGVLMEFKDRRFAIGGHTDNVPIRTRKFPNNWHLSTARAVSVLEFFIAQGFPATSLSATGFGEFDPVAPNDEEDGRRLNRRIEIILVPDLSELPTLTGDED
jgi:chemotaxis protein MotB